MGYRSCGKHFVKPFLTQHRRRWIAGFALASLAFAHAAIAGYGCLQGKMPEPQMACEEHENAAPTELLCRVHFQAETQTLDLAKLPQLFSFDSPVLVLIVEHTAPPMLADALLAARIAPTAAPPPSLTVLYSRFLT
jgi:hypothetical protein